MDNLPWDILAFTIAFIILISSLLVCNIYNKKKTVKQRQLNIITSRKLRGSPRKHK